MPKLTDTHLVILSAAAQHPDAVGLPLPESLGTNTGAATSALKGLVKRGLLAERPAANGEETWRETDDGQRLTLAITTSGLEAIGVDPTEAPNALEIAAAELKVPATTKPRAKKTAAPSKPLATVRPGTKQAILVDLLKRKRGATIAEAVEATGWQAHSIRGAISGAVKKKLGLAVETEVVEGRGRVYRITGTA